MAKASADNSRTGLKQSASRPEIQIDVSKPAASTKVPRDLSPAEWNRMLAEADRNWQEYERHWPSAKSVRYDRETKRFALELANGLRLEVPAAKLQGVAAGTEHERADVHTIGRGTCLEWRSLNQHFTIESLLTGCFGNPTWMATLNRKRSSPQSATKPTATRQSLRIAKRPRKAASAALS